MNYTVPILSIVFMAVSALAGVAIPTLLFIIIRKKHKADIAPFFTGCAVFIVFAILLEGLIHKFVFSTDVGKAIQNNIWIYGVYGGLMAGLFEETGRFTAFKTILRKKNGNDANALMYGAGHGGFEAFYILIFSMVSNIVMSVMLNAGMTDKLTAGVADEAALQTLYTSFAALSGYAPATFLMSVVERISAVALHISLSVLVWYSAKNGAKLFLLYPLSIMLHALVNTVAVIMSRYVSNLWLILGAVYLLTACCALTAVAVRKKASSFKGAADTAPIEEA